jgi:hypothetical protein
MSNKRTGESRGEEKENSRPSKNSQGGKNNNYYYNFFLIFLDVFYIYYTTRELYISE